MARKQVQPAARTDTTAADQPNRQRRRATERTNPAPLSAGRQAHPVAATSKTAAISSARRYPSAVRTADRRNSTGASSNGGGEPTPSKAGERTPPRLPRANTKRAALVALLERPQGAPIEELGRELGWLPNTVRAALTGLRQAGREVTRSKGEEGRSVYRLSPAEQ
jgi:hypothetical protein